MSVPDDLASVLNEFLRRHYDDRETGQERSLEEYQALFPGHEEAIAKELEELRADPSSDDERLIDDRFGAYRLLRRLGSGGQGLVYLAEDTRLDRQVALKLLTRSPFASDESRLRFQREARVASQLDDSGICTVHETGIEDGLPFIAMRYVEGETLAAKIAAARGREGSTSTDSHAGVTRLIEQVARSLHTAHAAGIVHRDVKPGNVMVTPEGDPVLLDFGLARVQDEDLPTLTRTGDVFGTPAYMPPEQFGADATALDHTADVYSLGVVLYECLTLHRPFEGATRDALYLAIRSENPPDPRRFSPDLPADLRVIVATALEKEPARRYRTALDLAEDLRRFRAGEPILARPPSRVYRVRKFVERNHILVAAVLVVVGALAVATAFSTRGLLQARAAEQSEAESARRTRRALHVFEDIFTSADPDREGREVTLLEVVDRSAAEVVADLADEPEIAGRLMASLGKVYTALGSYEAADPLLEQALEELEVALGPGDEDTLAAAFALATLRHRQARYSEAEALFLRVFEARRGALGVDDPETLRAELGLGALYREMGRYADAEAYLTRASQGLTNVEDPVHELAQLFYELGRLEEAEALWLDTARRSEASLGAEHTNTLRTYRALGKHYLEVGDYEEAERYYRRALEGLRGKLGEDSPEALAALTDLGFLYKSQGFYGKAEGLYVEALQGQLTTLDEDHPLVLATLNNLGRLYQAQGRNAEAEEHLRWAYEGRLRTNGRKHRETLVCMSNLGLFYEASGQLDEAEPLLVGAFELRSKIYGPTHRDTLTSLNNVAWFYRTGGDLERAEEMFVASYEGRREAFGDDDPYTLRALLNLGDICRLRKRLDEAEEHLLAALDGFREVVGDANPDTLTTLNQLVLLYCEERRFGEAEPLALELVDLTPADDPKLASREKLLADVQAVVE